MLSKRHKKFRKRFFGRIWVPQNASIFCKFSKFLPQIRTRKFGKTRTLQPNFVPDSRSSKFKFVQKFRKFTKNTCILRYPNSTKESFSKLFMTLRQHLSMNLEPVSTPNLNFCGKRNPLQPMTKSRQNFLLATKCKK